MAYGVESNECGADLAAPYSLLLTLYPLLVVAPCSLLLTLYSALVDLEYRQECFLWNFDAAHLLHALLALFLLFEELALA